MLRAKARCGYGRSCPFPRFEGVAINGHSPQRAKSMLRGENVRKHEALMAING